MQKFQLNDIFWTFQGEGYNAGNRALFVRMPHCNLNCSWCDTEYDSKSEFTDEQITEFAIYEKARFAVITGGEPLQNKETPIIARLLQGHGFLIATETNGTMPPVGGIDWFTCSPKRDAAYKIHRLLWPLVNEFKYVVDDDFDFSILDRHTNRIGQRSDVKLYLSPEFTKMKENLCKIQNFVKEHPEWRISLQTHKWMGIQ